MSESLRERVRAAYSWESVGSCFRCGAKEISTAAIGELQPAGEAVVLRACEPCVQEMEADRARDARRHGRPYEPGGPLLVDR